MIRHFVFLFGFFPVAGCCICLCNGNVTRYTVVNYIALHDNFVNYFSDIATIFEEASCEVSQLMDYSYSLSHG